MYDGVTATASPTEGAGLRAEVAIHAGEPVLTLPLTSTLSLAGELTGLPPPLVELVSGIEQPALALAVLLCFSLEHGRLVSELGAGERGVVASGRGRGDMGTSHSRARRPPRPKDI